MLAERMDRASEAVDRAARRGHTCVCAFLVAWFCAMVPASAARADPETGDDAQRASSGSQTLRRSNSTTFKATAYALEGKTAMGTIARKGVVAADPDVLPLGSRIRVTGAGTYSGEYMVEDTGPKVRGHEIDIKVSSAAEAKRFGERNVQVEVLSLGDGKKN